MSGTNFFNFKKPLFFVLSALVVYFFYNLLYIDKILPNVYFGNLPLSGRSKEQASGLVSGKINSFERSGFVFALGEEKIEADLMSLGVEFDRDATSSNVFSAGRTGNLKSDLIQKLRAPFLKTRILAVYRVDWQQLSTSLSLLLAKHEVPAKNATIIFADGQWQIQEESPGMVVDKTRLLPAIYEHIEELSDAPIEVPMIEQLPEIKRGQAESALQKIQTLSNQRIVLSFERKTWQLSGETLFAILKFFPQGLAAGHKFRFNLGQEPFDLRSIALVDSSAPLLDVGLDDGELDLFINQIAKFIDKPTINATMRFENGKILNFTPAQDGKRLDRQLARQLVENKVSIDNIGADETVDIRLPVTIFAAKIANEQINSLGIRELLGRGISYFSGSIVNRIHNLSLGASRISGTIVAPGEIFSFNSSVGDVSAATGYRQAYVISSGRTVLDDGGGICQVSTTVFRAALGAGLPIVARTAHAYRVGYYEQGGFKAGLDATVWAPAVDFQFKNDTNQHVLVQAAVETASAKLQVDIYGTSDGRRVEMTEPSISNQIPPPPDKYQDDPSLPRETVKQVDFAAWGATSVFTRKVYRESRLIINESFKSVFRPWQAVYLVGTGS